jgi:amidase
VCIHFVSIEPREPWGSAPPSPNFGAYVGEPEHSWIDDLDLTAREAIFRAPDSDTTLSLPLDPMHGTVG